jgi:hypothetical protein
MAEQLCCDYPFFRQLQGRKLDKDDPLHKRHVWIFLKTPEIEAAINEISLNMSNSKKVIEKKAFEGNKSTSVNSVL